MSAGSITTVRGYDQKTSDEPQFEIDDDRSLNEVKQMLISKGYDPVLTSWRKITNS
jgi:2-iminoacetate synthase